MNLSRRLFLSLSLATLVSLPAAAAQPLDKKAKPLPSWEKVSQSVDAYFAKDKARQPLDVISQSQVKPLFAELAKMNWNVKEQEAILAAVPADNSFLMKQLRSKDGQKFMRDFSKYPGGYDSLDRLLKLPHGKDTIRRLIKGPDGYKLIEYMDMTEGGTNLEKQLSNAPKGRNFTKPTGRIYTVNSLKAVLKQSHAQAAATQPR